MALHKFQLMDFEPLQGREETDVSSFHMQIYYVLEGSLSLRLDAGELLLKGKDFFLVNAGYRHSWQRQESTIAFCFSINEEELNRHCDISHIRLRCSSQQGEKEKHEALRRLLDQCVSYYYEKRSENDSIYLQLQSIYYQIVDRLLSEYGTVSSGDSPARETGSDEIRNYLYKNYASQITLSDMAGWLHLSPSYISLYLKKRLGATFESCLTDIRLEATARDLIRSEKSVTRAAMDNGFPNMTVFHKAFRKKYDMTPTQYREKWRDEAGTESETEIEDPDLEIRLMDYVTNMEVLLHSEDKQEVLHVDTGVCEYMNKTWSRMINVGRFSTLLQGDMQDQVLFLTDQLGYEYVRLWDLFSEEMHLNIPDHGNGGYNFKKLDRVFDFLTEHRLHPYIELGFKPNVLLDSSNNYYLFEEREILLDNLDELADFLRNMMIHLINRYGKQEVSQWYFEQWLDPRLCRPDDYEDYFQWFEVTCREIKSISPETCVCGCYDQSYEAIDFSSLIRDWSQRGMRPDYLVLYCYRETIEKQDYATLGYLPEDAGARTMADYLRDRRETMLEYDFDVPLNICEWGLSVSNRNALNDSCFKGAFLMKDIMQAYDQVDLMGYWMGSDLMVAETEPLRPLDGGCGLISYQGLCKPAFWAMMFMNGLGNYLLGKTDHVMVTKDNYGSYMIACHNCNDLDRQFYLMKGDIIEIEDMPYLFREKIGLKLHIEIDGAENGTYYVKTLNVKSDVGSVQDEWRRMGQIPELMHQDVEYLKSVSRPRVTIYELTVDQNRIELDLSLESQEIRSIVVSRQLRA